MSDEEVTYRKIIHIDMDAFFASIEQRDFPELRGKPIAVGGDRYRGVVAAASYEARKYGVYSAMASRIAFQKCPHIIFVKRRFDVYKEVSKQIMGIFRDYTDLVEPLSLDEAFLDVTINKKEVPSATLIAQEIRRRIKEELNLTASAGISINKFLAKVASDVNKPDGLTVILPEEAEQFLEELPIEKFHGIGKVTAEKMKAKGIFNGFDLKQHTRPELVRSFGKAGAYYFKIVRGEDNRVVTPNRIRKSISAENTFGENLTTEGEMLTQLQKLTESVSRSLEKTKLMGKTITIKIRDHEFNMNTRSKTLPEFTYKEEDIYQVVAELLRSPELPSEPIRLLGVGISNLNNEVKKTVKGQLTLDF
jgi:DNA polymerase-4